MSVPNAERAVVDLRKLTDYCLSSTHPRGKHKARVFAAALGITVDDADWLREELLDLVRVEEPIRSQEESFGTLYTLDGHLEFRGRRAVVRSHWLIRHGEDQPRLVTCYIA